VKTGIANPVNVRILDPAGELATTYRGTIHFTSNDASATLPPNYTFTAADYGRHTFSAILKSAGTQSITATDMAAPGVTGTVVEVRVFNRHGVEKDERAMAIEREEIERLAKDRDDELQILDRNVYARLKSALRSIRSPLIGDVRGRGLMLGVELVQGSGDPRPNAAATIRVVKGALRQGILLLGGGPDGNVLSLSPPFALTEAEIAWAAAQLAKLLEGVKVSRA